MTFLYKASRHFLLTLRLVMKRIIAFSLLCLFMNSAMLLPQVDEQWLHHSCSKHSNHVNSLVEWVDEVLLEHEDNSPEDEDDKKTFVNSMIDEGFCHRQHQRQDLLPYLLPSADDGRFADYKEGKLLNLTLDISVPPPEATA